MFEICFLGSGSGGNSILLRHKGTALLVDCGFTGRELGRRLERFGVELAEIDAVLLSHEHRDHITGLPVLARRPELRVIATPGTAAASRFGPRARCQRDELVVGQPCRVGAVQVHAFGISHDARQPVGFVLQLSDAVRIGIATDLGAASTSVATALSGCDYLGLEFNHDVEMLIDGPYPWYLKRRIQSNKGHLSNKDAAALLSRVAGPQLKHLFALHLSETNNEPSLAEEAAEGALHGLGMDVEVTVVGQQGGLRFTPAERSEYLGRARPEQASLF